MQSEIHNFVVKTTTILCIRLCLSKLCTGIYIDLYFLLPKQNRRKFKRKIQMYQSFVGFHINKEFEFELEFE
jgi:hypothetical protein